MTELIHENRPVFYVKTVRVTGCVIVDLHARWLEIREASVGGAWVVKGVTQYGPLIGVSFPF